MKLPDIEHMVLALSERERTALVVTLIESLSSPDLDISNEEAMQRDTELDSGKVKALKHEEFVRRVREARGK